MMETRGAVSLKGDGETFEQSDAKIQYLTQAGGRRLVGLPYINHVSVVVSENAMAVTKSVTQSSLDWDAWIQKARQSTPMSTNSRVISRPYPSS